MSCWFRASVQRHSPWSENMITTTLIRKCLATRWVRQILRQEKQILRKVRSVYAIWRINNALKLTAYYDFNKNEKSDNVKGYDADRKDDVFTLRLQYKF